MSLNCSHCKIFNDHWNLGFIYVHVNDFCFENFITGQQWSQLARKHNKFWYFTDISIPYTYHGTLNEFLWISESFYDGWVSRPVVGPKWPILGQNGIFKVPFIPKSENHTGLLNQYFESVQMGMLSKWLPPLFFWPKGT